MFLYHSEVNYEDFQLYYFQREFAHERALSFHNSVICQSESRIATYEGQTRLCVYMFLDSLGWFTHTTQS